MKSLEIAVIGPGAVGMTIGGLLRAAGHRVTFYGRGSMGAPDAFSIENVRGFARAGWSLSALAARADLLAQTATAMRQAARAVWTEGGPLGIAAALAPAFLYRRMLRALARRVSADGQEVWRHHGPKIWPQIRFMTDQVLARAARRGVRTDSIVALSASGGG